MLWIAPTSITFGMVAGAYFLPEVTAAVAALILSAMSWYIASLAR